MSERWFYLYSSGLTDPYQDLSPRKPTRRYKLSVSYGRALLRPRLQRWAMYR